MSQALPGVISVLLGCSLVLLGRWGIRNGDELVSTAIAETRRTREIRSIKRGSRSCLVLGALFCLAGTALAISGAHP
jgi:hypothetical protein